MKSNKIYIFDLHNTLYDEVTEFGCAIHKAIEYLIRQDLSLDKDNIYEQFSTAHAQLGSDWDNDVWDHIPEFRKLQNFETLKNKAISIRAQTSEALTKSTAFKETITCIKILKKKGNTIHLATEATQNAASDAINWLELDGIIDTVYSWPFHKSYTKRLQYTRLKLFPPNPKYSTLSLQKPHALILGQILLDEAKKRSLVPHSTSLSEVFELVSDDTLDLNSLEKIESALTNTYQKRQVKAALEAIRSYIKIKPGVHQKAMESIKSLCFYIGDSFFKDGFLAKNADIPFIFAAYGKAVSPQNKPQYDLGKKILFQVTGWDRFLMKLTQQTNELPQLTGKIKPHFTCKNGLQDFVNF